MRSEIVIHKWMHQLCGAQCWFSSCFFFVAMLAKSCCLMNMLIFFYHPFLIRFSIPTITTIQLLGIPYNHGNPSLFEPSGVDTRPSCHTSSWCSSSTSPPPLHKASLHLRPRGHQAAQLNLWTRPPGLNEMYWWWFSLKQQHAILKILPYVHLTKQPSLDLKGPI